MRLVATSDTHHTVDISTIPDGDVFVHAGDLMRTGYINDWYTQLEWLSQLPHKIKLFVPGNHDFHLQVYPGPALQELRNIGVWVIGLPGNTNYNYYNLPNGMSLLGLPYVTNLPRWAFNIEETDLEKHLSMIGRHDIVVSHAPAQFHLDFINGKHVGIKAYADYAKKHNPLHWICGHIHEGYGNVQYDYDSTMFHNVAMCDRDYIHTNPPLVLDL